MKLLNHKVARTLAAAAVATCAVAMLSVGAFAAHVAIGEKDPTYGGYGAPAGPAIQGNIMLIGAPGCGKSMMAKRLPGILPRLTLAESLETTQIHSVAGKLGAETSLVAQRPFRPPHHTISDVALIGGGTSCKPGEISLAHNGVLFLDELPEFSRTALETLRQPLEDREITISRSKYTVTLPCSFMLVASMNPCPCGY